MYIVDCELANIGFCECILCNSEGDSATEKERYTCIYVHIYTWPSLQSLRGWGFDGLRKGSRGSNGCTSAADAAKRERAHGQCVYVEMTTMDGGGLRTWGYGGGYEIWNFVIRSPVYRTAYIYIARETPTESRKGLECDAVRWGELINNSIPF